MEKIKYAGWANCYRIANEAVELVVTGDVGPRIIRFGFVGGPNEFKEYPDLVGRTGGDEWRIYGGHRLWHAPEARPRTYFPDNAPVRVRETAAGLYVAQPTETTTGIRKEIDVRLSAGPHVTVTHRLINEGTWEIELAPWALSVMAQGGRAVIPLPPRGPQPENLAPTSVLSVWAYTDMSDPRWTWGRKYILLRQDATLGTPQKIGVSHVPGWLAYLRGGHLFVKKFAYRAGACYPDFGACVEVFTNADMLEAETLGPLVRLAPGTCVEHVEEWSLYDGVPASTNDAEVEEHVLPKVTVR